MNPESKTQRKLWLQDRLVAEDEAKIPVASPTTQYGLNVFEVFRCYESHDKKELLAFRFQEHLDRLVASARLLGFEAQHVGSNIWDACEQTVKANADAQDITVRVTLYVDGPGSWSYRGPLSPMVFVTPRGRIAGFDSGISACVSSWERIHERSMSPRAKSGANYINSRMAQLEALDNGYDMGLFLNREGRVAEAVGSCVFAVKGNKLITPSLGSSILESITRDTIIQLAAERLGMKVEERSVERSELYTCDELFICGTTAEIVPIVSIDRRPVGDGKVGKMTRAIQDTYFDVARGNVSKYRDWLTPIGAQ